MERSNAFALWAAASIGVIFVIVGAVEWIWAVLAEATDGRFAAWNVAYIVYVAVYAALTFTVQTRSGPFGLPWVPVLAVALLSLAGASVVLLSHSRGGLSLILLVFTAALTAYWQPMRVTAVVVAFNGVVIATSVALGDTSPWVETIIATVLYTVLQAVSVGVVYGQQREADAMQRLAAAHVELRGATALLAETSQAEERLRIARELHDVLGHQLTVLALELEIATHKVEGAAAEHVARARHLAGALLGDVRAVVGEERTKSFPLRSTIESLIADLPRPTVELTVDDTLDIDPADAAVIIRCVQEIVTNAIRHSSAERLSIRVGQDAGAITVRGEDDGVGAATFTVGNGLAGLTERVESRGGTVDIGGDGGFTVRARIPTGAAR